MGRLSASASSENGFHTALAKSPPRWARPTTACCAPLSPPGSGAIRATAVTMRTIAQAPKPKRPSRAVSTVPAAACQMSRKPASTRTPALKANSMSPTAEGPCAPRPPRNDSTSRVALSVSAKRPRSMDCAERRIGRRDRGEAEAHASRASSAAHSTSRNLSLRNFGRECHSCTETLFGTSVRGRLPAAVHPSSVPLPARFRSSGAAVLPGR